MAEEKKEEKAAAPPAKKANTALLLQLIFSVVNLAVVGGGAYFVYASTLGYQSPSISDEDLAHETIEQASTADEAPYVYTMEKFTINLAGEPKRTIRLEVNLQMLGKDGFEEIMNAENRARSRDRINRLLSEKTFSELDTIQGKLFLKDKIASDVNQILHRGVVKDVFFTELNVQ